MVTIITDNLTEKAAFDVAGLLLNFEHTTQDVTLWKDFTNEGKIVDIIIISVRHNAAQNTTYATAKNIFGEVYAVGEFVR